MDAKQELIQRIQAGSGSYSPYEVFTDWITCLALSIVNACTWEHGWLWEKREQQYKEIMKKHGEKANVFFEMTGLLAMALEDKIEDVLGEVYMRSGCGNKNTGQFFTPFHLSKLSAELGLGNKTPESLELNEPSCGAGGMIIAAAAVIKIVESAIRTSWRLLRRILTGKQYTCAMCSCHCLESMRQWYREARWKNRMYKGIRKSGFSGHPKRWEY